jgi:PAS domain S-box-containing protein
MNENMLHEAFLLFAEKAKQMEETHKSLHEEILLLRNKFETTDWALKTILSQLSEGLIFVTVEGKMILFNESALALTDQKEKDVIDASFWDFFDNNFFGFSLKEALLSEQKKQKSFILLKNSQGTREVEVSLSVVSPYGGIIILRDLTDLRRLEQVVLRNDRLKELGEMAAALAHEIRNPLGGIEGFASLLAQDLKHMPAQRKMALAIIEGTQSLNHLVTQVLNYSHPLQFSFALCDLKILIEDVMLLLKSAHPESSLLFESQDRCIIMADKQHLKRALINLILNAIQASTEQTPVTIVLSKDQESVHIDIIDKGAGIHPEDLEKIFIPFFSCKPQGTGLGLSEAQKIIHAHGGAIQVFSTRLKGSVFRVKLPKNEKG